MDLFGTGTTAIDESFGTAVRYDLDGTSWVETVPHWLTGADELVRALRDTVPFEQHQRWIYDRKVDEPRLTAEYADLTNARSHSCAPSPKLSASTTESRTTASG
jgi:hypothetical protein